MEIEMSLDSSALQARAMAYHCNFTLTTSSPTPTPFPEARSITFAGNAYIAATPAANFSTVTLLANSSDLVAGGSLLFYVIPADSARTTILDAASLSYSAVVVHTASDTSSVCRPVLFNPSSKRHEGNCELPASVDGSPPVDGFYLEVNDAQEMPRLTLSIAPTHITNAAKGSVCSARTK